MLSPKDWKEKWKTIDSIRDLIDTSIRDRVSARTLDSWEAMSSIEKGTENVLKTVEEIQDVQRAAHEVSKTHVPATIINHINIRDHAVGTIEISTNCFQCHI
jgi:hypothetical protein